MSVWNQYTIRVVAGEGWNHPQNPRDALQKFLAGREIASETYYPLPMHLQQCFSAAGETPEPLPVSERLANEALSLPIFPELSREQQDFVIGAIRDFMLANG